MKGGEQYDFADRCSLTTDYRLLIDIERRIIGMYLPLNKKRIIYKLFFLLCSLAVFLYVTAFIAAAVQSGFKGTAVFSELIDTVAAVFALLFEGTVIVFILRSFKLPTVLIKNIVFRRDGTINRPGFIFSAAGAAISAAASGVFLYSAHIKSIIPMLTFLTQMFIAGVSLIMFVNLLFVVSFYFVFRHEASVFDII